MRPFPSLIVCLTALVAAASTVPTPVRSVEEFRTGAIRIYGNKKIKSYIIRRAIPLKTGEPFTSTGLDQSREKLRALPGIDYSEIRVAHSPDYLTLNLSVIITEKSARSGTLLIERGYQNKMSFGVTAEERNFRGRSERVHASVLLRGNRVIEAGWANPWLGGTRVGLALDGHFKSYRYVYDDVAPPLRGAQVKRWGGLIELSRTLGGTGLTMAGTLGYEDVSGAVAGLTVDADGDRHVSVGARLTHDNRDEPVFPWSGARVSAGIRRVAVGDDAAALTEGSVHASAFHSVASRLVLALSAGYTGRDGANIPAYRREHLGGARTLRGYDYGSFNGVSAVVGTVECRMPLNFSPSRSVGDVLAGISTHVFVDAATAWESGESLSADRLRGTFGLGVALLSTDLPGIRLDYGWHPESSGRLEVDVGMKF